MRAVEPSPPSSNFTSTGTDAKVTSFCIFSALGAASNFSRACSFFLYVFGVDVSAVVRPMTNFSASTGYTRVTLLSIS